MVFWLNQTYLGILACTENTLKAFKRLRRICQEYFAVYGEYADRHKIEPFSADFRPEPKKILNPHSIHDRIGKKPSHATVPLKAYLMAASGKAPTTSRRDG